MTQESKSDWGGICPGRQKGTVSGRVTTLDANQTCDVSRWNGVNCCHP